MNDNLDSSNVPGYLDQENTFHSFDYDAIDGIEEKDEHADSLEVLANFSSYVTTDLRIEKMSDKSYVYSKFLGLPVKAKVLDLTSEAVLDVTEKINQLGLSTKSTQEIFTPIMAWITQGRSYNKIGDRTLIFVFCVHRSLLPFNTLEDLGIWMGVSKVRVQHLISEFHLALGLRYKTNKTVDRAKYDEVLEDRIKKLRANLIKILEKQG